MKTWSKIATMIIVLLLVLSFAVSCAPATTTEPAQEEEQPAQVDTSAEAAQEVPATEAPAEESTSDQESEDSGTAEEGGMTASGFTLAPEIAARAAAGEQLVFKVSYQDIANEFAPFIKRGVEDAVAEFDVDAELVGPVGSDADAQIAELESLAATGIDGLAISSVSTDALAPIINRFLEQGIPVVTYNTDNPASDRLAFAGQDLVTSGYEAAKVLAELLGGEGDVLILTLDAAAQWSIDRENGAREGFAEYPDINILQTVNTGSEPQEMYGAIENAMLANPSVVGVLSLECCSTPSIGEYVKRNDLADEVTVVGFDELPATLELIRDGAIKASVSQAPERQSYEAIRLLIDAINGNPVEDVDTGIAVIDAENLDAFIAAMGGN